MYTTHPLAIRLASLFMVILFSRPLPGDDWLTYRHDPTRSGVSSDTLDAESLGLSWKWRSPAPPASAWSGPAKWDAYAGIRGLRSMRDYDPAFAPIATEQHVYFGSSSDDSIRCLDLETGESRWIFTAGGAIRIAPCFSYGKIYFGSDDGFAYCLDAETGQLVWKCDPLEISGHREKKDPVSQRLIINNGRAIPFWPIRSGVTVVDGTAYFAASMLPWKESYLCAVDAEKGRPTSSAHYAKRLTGQTMEGAIAVSPGRLVVPQGRVAPELFERLSGKSLGALEGGGGCFVVVTPEGTVFHGPGNKTGWITSSNSASRETIATYAGGNVLCIDRDHSFLLTDNTLAATDFKQRKLLWNVASDTPHTMIVSANAVICGGTDEVVIYDRRDGSRAWRATVDGHVHELALSGGRLLVSTDTGEISCFASGGSQPQLKKVAPASGAGPAGPIRAQVPGIVSQWRFHPGLIRNGTLPDLVGNNNILLPSAARFESVGEYQALALLDAPGSITVKEQYREAGLPSAELTAEAWVRVDKKETWGGIIGAIQDNGDYERGWILGYKNDRFSFAVASEREPVAMTYLAARMPFETGRWYHVAGTYDGTAMTIYVDGKEAGTSDRQQGLINYPPQARFEIAGYRDDNENFPLAGMLHEVRVYEKSLSAEVIQAHAAARVITNPERARLPFGPYIQFRDAESALVRWETAAAVKSHVTLNLGDRDRNFVSDSKDGRHEILLTGLKSNRQYKYRVGITDGESQQHTEWYECDTFFNYGRARINSDRTSFGKEAQQVASGISRQVGAGNGVAVILGIEDGHLSAQLAVIGGIRVIAFDERQEAVDKARAKLLASGLYGTHVSVQKVSSLDNIPLTGMVANIVLSERQLSHPDHPVDWAEAYRLACPNGGVLISRVQDAGPHDFPGAEKLSVGLAIVDGLNLQFGKRPPLPGAGEWSHLYGKPDNSAFGGESLQGVKKRDDLQVQWIGRPGARYQPDRNGRKPSPLSVGGRLYLQGLQRIIALDAYNGSILWSLEIPALGRFNMPRDCSNWCADENHLYLAIDGECWMLDGRSGDPVRRFTVPGNGTDDNQFHWGYLASTDNLLLGTAVIPAAPFRNFWGGANEGWYDAKGGDATGKICSDRYFAYDKNTGDIAWEYSGGLLINPTLTASKDRVFFVENRNPELVESKDRRVSDPRLWKDQYLVALERKTGKKLWEYSLATEPGTVVYYLAHSGDKLSLVASSNKKYHVYVFDSEAGAANWENHFPWPSDNHGGHMSRPAIVGTTLYVRPRAFDITSGQVLDKTVPMGGCGTYAATSDALFFRSGNVTVWDRQSGTTTAWTRLRPDCWLSTIPAGGMLLSPEGGGGCSCGSWIETSIGFIPRALLER